MASARGDKGVRPLKLGEITHSWGDGARRGDVRQEVQAHLAVQRPWVLSMTEQNVAEARKFKDFWRANLGHAAAAVTSFVNVNVINVSGMAGNCLLHCTLHAATSLDDSTPSSWGINPGDSLEEQAATLRF